MAINTIKTSTEAFNAKKMANPNWRIVNKKHWVDSKQPFNYRKADESLICDRTSKLSEKTDPYTGISAPAPPRKAEERLSYSVKQRDDWSPDAIHRRSV